MTVPRTCAGCDLKPVATNGSSYCYDCKKSPRGPRTPPPCRTCGSVTGYYAGGLCRRCHRFAPPVTGSCVDCLGWGVTRATGWLCEGCRGWRRRISRGEGTCVTCGSPRHLNSKGLCRLCRRQAAMVRAGRDGITAAQAGRHGQQLYFIYPGGTFRGSGKPRPAASPQPAPGRTYPVTYRQLALFDMPRDLAAGRLRGFPAPRDPGLAAVLDRAARDHAARHGWTKSRTVEARQAIRILLGLQETPGAPVNASEVTALARIGFAAQPVLDILTAVTLLHDDRDPPVAAWFARQITGLPAPMISELRIWFDVMHRGSSRAPRRLPRSPVTIRLHLSWAMPALRAWAAGGHQSLREISRAEVIAALPSGGTPRAPSARDCGRCSRS